MKCILKHIVLSLAIGLASLTVQATDTLVLNQIDSIVAMGVDAKGYLFVADEANTLYKFDQSGKILVNANIKVYGSIDKIDCSNPFEIYTYHKDQNIIVYYDNMLNVKGTTPLNDFYFNNVVTIERSYDNGIWLFNSSDFKLQKIDKNGQVFASSFNLLTILGENLAVYDISEFNNKVYVVDSVKGLFEFDLFGTYGTTHHIDSLTSFVFANNQLYGTKNNKPIQYSILIRNISPMKAMVTENGIAGFYRQKFYSFKNNFIVTSSAE